MTKAQELMFAVVGAGDFAFEKVRGVRRLDRKSGQRFYKDFVKRGRTLTGKIKNSGPTRQAVAQTKVARAQVKAAATSVTKAVKADAKATKAAASKTTKAS